MNFLNIPQAYFERVTTIYELIKEDLPDSHIYLFGSYAKRKIKPTSDLDFLILIDEGLDKKALKKIKWSLEEKIEDSIQFSYEVDLKLYTQEHFEKSLSYNGFEQEINQYMIKLEETLWK